MMSNPPSSLHQQRVHRRQNSTPVVAFEAMKVSSMNPTTRQGVHRRGQSYDQRSPIRRQFGNAVSIANLGTTQQGQQILREAQQQRTARPGQQQVDIPVSPQCGIYPVSSASMPGTPFEDITMQAIMQEAQNLPIARTQYFSHYSGSMHGDYQSLGLDENNPNYFQMSHSLPHDQFDGRRMSQPDLRVQTSLRPHTPIQQIQTAQFPLTPPFSQNTQANQYSRSLQASPSIPKTYPVQMQRGRSLEGITEHEEIKHHIRFSTPPQVFEAADIPIPESMNPKKQSSPSKMQDSLSVFDDSDSPEVPQFNSQSVPILSTSQAAGSQSPNRLALSPRRMSISDLNLEPGIEASIEETNITLDDIAQFIEGPDPVDNKWICKYEDCNKRFGRKENIKSHVQTHLGDRQFRCDHCKKCFVRGHDLKRHAKIHTGTKPYPCLCGNAFARHDALTRHRQRGMCIGAFDGVVKKTIKRGRPRKHRPEMDERLDKASRTRKLANDQFDHYTSSASSCSMSSWGSPPTENMDALSIRGNSPFDDLGLFDVPQHSLNIEAVGLPPEMFSFTPPASPGYSTGNKPSPSYRELTPSDLDELAQIQAQSVQVMDELPVMDHASLSANDMTIQHSQHSLPSLSHSSSSPAADIVAFDFSDMPSSTIQHIPMKLDPERNDFDNFLDYNRIDMGLDPNGTDSFFADL